MPKRTDHDPLCRGDFCDCDWLALVGEAGAGPRRMEYRQAEASPTVPISVGVRVIFTNPATGQQLIGTVVGHDPENLRGREWRVDFDSWMFHDAASRTANVAAANLAVINYAYQGLAEDSHEA